MPSKRRIQARRILSDPDARRKLMVRTIQATQAREGIQTSESQAERAYYVVTEAEQAAFFGLAQDKGGKNQSEQREQSFVRALRGDDVTNYVRVSRRDFSVIDHSPLLFSQVQVIAPLFRENPRLNKGWASVRGGMNSTASERFVRHFWEVTSSTGKTWVKFSKGGPFSRFYSALELVFDWTDAGKEFRGLVKRLYGSESRFVKSPEFYFKRGLTWTEKSSLGLSVRILDEGAIFNVSGPGAFPLDHADEWYLLGVLNSEMIAFVAWALSGRNYGAEYVGGLPIPRPSQEQHKKISQIAKTIFDIKKSWDTSNEVSTSFAKPWILREDILDPDKTITERLHLIIDDERGKDARIQQLYAELNEEVYSVYDISGYQREKVEVSLGERPRELVWLQMGGKETDQKRMEHVYRLLSYIVKCVVEEDEDGIVPFISISCETNLVERVHHRLEGLFPNLQVAQVEAQVVNELKKRVKGYKRTESIAQWLENIFFDYHSSLYEKRPVIWHIASKPGAEGRAAFGALVDYHKFDKNGMAKLRGTYLRDAIGLFRREAGLALKEGRNDDQIEWQSRLEEAGNLDERLRLVQEGHCEGMEEAESDFRILTPWKSPDNRPKGWDPDIDDGVKVNIEPLQKARVLRIQKVV